MKKANATKTTILVIYDVKLKNDIFNTLVVHLPFNEATSKKMSGEMGIRDGMQFFKKEKTHSP